MTETIFSQLKSGYRVKLKSKLTDVEKGQTTNRHGWDPEKDGILGRWCAIVNFVGSESVSINADSGTDRHFHKSNLELAEIPADSQIKQVPITETIYQKLKKGDRVKLKSKLTEEEKKQTEKFYNAGWDSAKDKLLGNWVVINEIVTHGVKVQTESGAIWTFHKSNLNLAEITDPETDSDETIEETEQAKFEKVKAEFDSLVGRQSLKDHF